MLFNRIYINGGEKMQSCELVTAITAIACAIANNYSEEEIGVLASAFNQLGDTLATIVAQEACITSNKAINNKVLSDDSADKESNDNNPCLQDSSQNTSKKNNV
jgi:hypothetical protein